MTIKSHYLTKSKFFLHKSLIIISLSACSTLLTACDDTADNEASETEIATNNASSHNSEMTSKIETEHQDTTLNELSNEVPQSTRNTPLTIDWTKVDSKVKPVDKDSFDYPFALDSKPVLLYADSFKLPAKIAQYNLTVGMASNEVLDPLLDQLGDSYLSHQLVDGKDYKLVIHTTPNVSASHYDYVIAHEFAHGLVLPVEISPEANDSANP